MGVLHIMLIRCEKNREKKLRRSSTPSQMVMSSTKTTEIPMFKNKLQEYAQKRGMQIPAYRTTNEGFQHAPKFRSTVFVDGVEYTSKQTFRHVREAEQDAAKLAYECIQCNNAQQLGAKPLLSEDPKSKKSILYEFACKQHYDKPTYKTYPLEGPLPVFVSTVTVASKSFTGDGSKSKKDAEQLAAHAALQSLIGTDSGAVLNQMLRSKRECNVAPKRVDVSGYSQKKPRITTAKGPEAVSKPKGRMPLLSSTPPSTTAVRQVRSSVKQRNPWR